MNNLNSFHFRLSKLINKYINIKIFSIRSPPSVVPATHLVSHALVIDIPVLVVRHESLTAGQAV